MSELTAARALELAQWFMDKPCSSHEELAHVREVAAYLRAYAEQCSLVGALPAALCEDCGCGVYQHEAANLDCKMPCLACEECSGYGAFRRIVDILLDFALPAVPGMSVYGRALYVANEAAAGRKIDHATIDKLRAENETLKKARDASERFIRDLCALLDLEPADKIEDCAFMVRSEVERLQRARPALLAKQKHMHRRAQRAESDLRKLRKAFNRAAVARSAWDSPERQQEAAERDRMMETVGRFAPIVKPCTIPLDGSSALHSALAEGGELDDHIRTRHSSNVCSLGKPTASHFLMMCGPTCDAGTDPQTGEAVPIGKESGE